ncbi:protein kinase [Streptomyces sp. NBC_01549]|uniref:protein kinase domain-containing protein n=1 Tax=Streptomyces sp. NBC_01549 TaxID=2975874 RepID=UPI002258034B|nr:protein kinase [Streptomyces sp. NBC_01549]MCX4597513.1 protein kinase [Streptomyces sp. NBC_01549]
MHLPHKIGRYRVERLLGTGAFAVVWLAYDDSLDAPVAVKVMTENWSYRLDMRERFLTEARLLRQAASSRVIQVYDVGELDDGRPYFVMEYAGRGTLADRLADVGGPLPTAEALRLATEAARGTAALHEAGVLHRDVKPSNILVGLGPGGRDRVLMGDLGLAKSLAHASSLTLTAGSVGYMAPEQSDPDGAGMDGRSDVYGLGAVTYELLTGKVPGPAGSIVPLHELRPDLPAAVQGVVTRALEADRELRFASAAQFADELSSVIQELVTTGSVPDPSPEAVPAPPTEPTEASDDVPACDPATDAPQPLPQAAAPAGTRRAVAPRRRLLVATAVVGAAVALLAGGLSMQDRLALHTSTAAHSSAPRVQTSKPPADATMSAKPTHEPSHTPSPSHRGSEPPRRTGHSTTPVSASRSPSPSSSPSASASPKPLYIRRDQQLMPGQFWRSDSSTVNMQADGNLVIRDEKGMARWSSGTADRGYRAIMQADGNFVVYDRAGLSVWGSGTAGHDNAVLCLRPDGDVTVEYKGAVLWSAGTGH